MPQTFGRQTATGDDCIEDGTTCAEDSQRRWRPVPFVLLTFLPEWSYWREVEFGSQRRRLPAGFTQASICTKGSGKIR
jgi:hypothetical protein